MTGQERLHERVLIAAAGNLATDRAITNELSTAMQSRVVHIEMEHDFAEWYEDVAMKENYDLRIKAFLSYQPSALMDFRPEHNEKTFCCPRTWEFVNRLLRNIPNAELDDYQGLIAGTITSATAISFVTFTRLFSNLPRFENVIKDPELVPVPIDAATRFACIAHLLEYIDDKTFEQVSKYVNRFQTETRVMFYRSLMVQHPEWRKTETFVKAMVELNRYLHSDD